MASQDPPKIQYPCSYPIKVLGRAAPGFQECVIGIMHKHVADLDELLVTERPSGKGTFVAITVIITATGKDQIDAIFADLMASKRVQMVL